MEIASEETIMENPASDQPRRLPGKSGSREKMGDVAIGTTYRLAVILKDFIPVNQLSRKQSRLLGHEKTPAKPAALCRCGQIFSIPDEARR